MASGQTPAVPEVDRGSSEGIGNDSFRPMERLSGMSSSSEATTTPRTCHRGFVRRILADCLQPVSPGAIDRFSDSPRVRGIYAAIVASFPDAAFTPLWCTFEGDLVALGGLTHATHRGDWRGVPATGRPVEVLSIVMLELSDGGIVDLMVVTDSLTIAEQIGIVEPLGAKACQLLEPPSWLGRTPFGNDRLLGHDAS
jgi:hypothetical protein